VPTFDPYAELTAIAKGFADNGVPYSLCGAVALAVHGHPRATKDVDLLLPTHAIEDAKAVLRGLGYGLEAAPMEFKAGIEVHRVSRVEDKQLFTIDLLTASGPLDEVWAGRIEIEWRGITVSTVSRDGLIAMKRLAGRAQDLADLEALGATDSDG